MKCIGSSRSSAVVLFHIKLLEIKPVYETSIFGRGKKFALRMRDRTQSRKIEISRKKKLTTNKTNTQRAECIFMCEKEQMRKWNGKPTIYLKSLFSFYCKSEAMSISTTANSQPSEPEHLHEKVYLRRWNTNGVTWVEQQLKWASTEWREEEKKINKFEQQEEKTTKFQRFAFSRYENK